MQQVDRKYRCVVRPHLRDLADADFARAPRDSLPGDKPTLFVNARLVPSSSVADLLPELLAAGHSGKVRVGPHTALAVTRTHTTEDLSQPDKLAAWLDAVPDATLDAQVSLFTWPHDVVARHLEITGDNLERRVGGGAYREEREGVFLGPDARLGPHVVTDTQAGPIVLESGVTVGAHAYLRGPLHLAADVTGR